MMKRFVATALAVAFALSLGADLAVAAAKPAPSAKVNINTASVEQLTTLPGVGPKLAARILEYRQKSGAFKSVSELMNVRGIGEKNLKKIEQYLSAGDAASRSGATK
jgi:competence protein ComEA